MKATKTYTLCRWCGKLVESMKLPGGRFLQQFHKCAKDRRTVQ